MNATEFITIMYSMVGIIAIIGYLPQIITLVKNNSCVGISIKSWIVCTYTSAVSTCYAFYVISDSVLKFVTTVNLVCCSVILYLALQHKRKSVNTQRQDTSLQNKKMVLK